jgi:hypothetical protein
MILRLKRNSLHLDCLCHPNPFWRRVHFVPIPPVYLENAQLEWVRIRLAVLSLPSGSSSTTYPLRTTRCTRRLVFPLSIPGVAVKPALPPTIGAYPVVGMTASGAGGLIPQAAVRPDRVVPFTLFLLVIFVF